MKINIIKAVLLMVVAAGCGGSAEVNDSNAVKKTQNKPQITKSREDIIIEKLKKSSANLKSYQADITYIFRQPMLESVTIRTGKIYYQKEKEGSKLRVNFETIKQDDEVREKYVEHIYFDGVWLWRIDYQLETAKAEQVTDINEPIDAFDFASGSLPIIGFSEKEDLKEKFDIKLIDPNHSDPVNTEHLLLVAKSGLRDENEYKIINFWIEKNSYLPAKIVTSTVEKEIYEIILDRAIVNKKLPKGVFDLVIPDNFDKSELPLRSKKAK